MDIRFLVTFIEVTNTRHFGKAAENLYLTQSAVSARIKQLEEYFNAPLFIRHRNSIQLTITGEKLLPYAQKLAITLGEARKALSEVDMQHLVLAGTPNAWELSLQYGLVLMKEQYTHLSIRAEILNTEQLSRQLHEHTVDLAFSVEQLKSDDVKNIQIAESELGFYSTHQTVLENALQHYIHVDWGVKTSETIEKLYPPTKKATLRTGSVQVGLEFILKHGGTLALPKSLAPPWLEQKQLFEIKTLTPLSVKTFLIFMRDTKQSGLSELIDFFLQNKDNLANMQDLRMAQN